MKIIQHSVFAESKQHYPLLSLLSSSVVAQRGRERDRIRERANAFINEIGAESVVSVCEHASTLGPFSVVVWWYREMPETETLIIRPANETATS